MDVFEESLAKYAISETLLSIIVKLTSNENIFDFINGESICIDNAYAERKAVHDVIGILVLMSKALRL